MPNLRMAVGARRTLMLNTVIVRAFWATVLARRLSRRAYSRAGYFVPAVGIAGIAACLVEVASQFRKAGRPIPKCQSFLRGAPDRLVLRDCEARRPQMFLPD